MLSIQISPKLLIRFDIALIKKLHSYGILLLLLSAVTHVPFHAPVLRPTSWPNARDRRDGEVN